MSPTATLSGVTLDGSSPTPLYRQIYEGIARAVLEGRLPPGARLPSARSLASQLSVARGTVETAYHLLAGEGYVVARGAAGTIVDPDLDCRLFRAGRAARPGGVAPPAAGPAAGGAPPLLRTGLPALDAFPRRTWARLVQRQLRSSDSADLAYPHPAGSGALRAQIAAYLQVARGVACTPEQVFITTGYQGALGLVARCLLQPGDAVWMEDPGYPDGRDALRLAGARIAGVRVDREGFDVERALAREPRARLAVLTPTHHYPLGMPLSLPRRMTLLEWAAAAEAWIVEDDYSSEFRYRGKPLPALKSLDLHDRVLYAGTFSKVLSPALRVGYLVVPPGLVERFARVATLLQALPASLVQAAVAAFLEEGHMGRHIRRMRQLYARRRAALADALRRHAPPALDLELQPGGMHLLARLPPDVDDAALVARLARRGMAPGALSACGIETPYAPGLLLGFTNVDAEGAEGAARRLGDGVRAFLDGDG